jgi:glutamate synthase domain-containing protein 3
MKSLSLKEIEGNLGLAIVENDLLDKDKLTDEEYKEVLEYNKHDVLATYKLYQQIKDEVECKKELIDDFKLDKKCFNETYVAIARKILDAKIIKQDESFIYHKPSCINLDHKDIENIFNNVEFNLDSEIKEEKEINGLKIVFGIGGVHGSIDNFKYKYDNDHVIVILDVESMYPNFMENKNNKEFNFLSRSVDNPNLFAIIKEKRIKYKHNGNKKKSNAYKVVINGQYGASIFFYNNKQPAPLTD